jgi:hypothetical protein
MLSAPGSTESKEDIKKGDTTHRWDDISCRDANNSKKVSNIGDAS